VRIRLWPRASETRDRSRGIGFTAIHRDCDSLKAVAHLSRWIALLVYGEETMWAELAVATAGTKRACPPGGAVTSATTINKTRSRRIENVLP
jgi:hypothetical protein